MPKLSKLRWCYMIAALILGVASIIVFMTPILLAKHQANQMTLEYTDQATEMRRIDKGTWGIVPEYNTSILGLEIVLLGGALILSGTVVAYLWTQGMENAMKSEKGFTLIELLVVVAILGVLATIALPNIIGMLAKGDEVKAEAETATVQTAADAYAVDTGTPLPAGTIDLADLEQWLRKTPAGTFTIDAKGTVTRN